MSTYDARFVRQINAVSAARWDALLPDDQPFLRHAFLDALEAGGSIRSELGWVPNHVLLFQHERLVGAAPCYLKFNSHGEFVFDWAWADAYQRHGLAYYPKLLVGVPYTPVTGARLLIAPGADAAAVRKALLDALLQGCRELGCSSVHMNFPQEVDAAASASDPWLPRSDWQFHWDNRGYADFEDFLESLTSKKRKNIRQERRRLDEAGIQFRWRTGWEIDAALWQTLHSLYASTFEAKWNTPALTLDTFRRIGAGIPAQVLAITAEWEGEVMAMALCLRDSRRLYGRYWGSFADLPGLHFETCYYQGIEYAIASGLEVYEPGAQGEHKIARGFLPRRVRSSHHIEHPGFRIAIRKALAEEQQRRVEAGEWYSEHSPYRESEPESEDDEE